MRRRLDMPSTRRAAPRPSPRQPPRHPPRPPPPPAELVGVVHLVPPELDEPTEQRELELPVEPVVGRDAVALERLAVGRDRGLLGLGYPVGVDPEVPREVVARWPGAWPLPV